MQIDRNEVNVGGPNGIQIRSGNAHLPRYEPARQDPAVALELVRQHPRAVAGVLTLAAAVMLLSPAVVIPALGLSWVFYIVPAVVGTTSLGVAVAAARGAFSRATPNGLEQQILSLAMRSGGELTVADTAHAFGISLSEAEEGLMSMARAGHVDIENDANSGAILYVFRDIRGRQLPNR